MDSSQSQFEAAEQAIIAGDADALARLLPAIRAQPESRPWFGRRGSPQWIGPEDVETDARSIILREHCFENWPEFTRHREARATVNSPVARFESAVDAIVNGEADALDRILRQDPDLIRARSARAHRVMLLHYLGANGVENYRQRTPKNAVQIAIILLTGGAAVDAEAGLYGKGTTLGLVATSIHPKLAGVQIPLLETLLDAGASADGIPEGWNPLVSALHNGRPEAAAFLAGRGARLNLEGAAGVGRLDVVRSFVDPDGSRKEGATQPQLEAGFMWACEYGRNSVVAFLLAAAVPVHVQDDQGMTGLHWAVIGGQMETIQLLLERSAPLEMQNSYGGTVLDQALWCVGNGDPTIDYVPVIRALADAGANREVYPGMKERVEQVLR